MWPLISPAISAPVSAIFALISECPVRHISGLPPRRSTSSNSIWLALTSAMTVAPGFSASTSGGEDGEELVAPQDTAPRIDGADAVAVAVEGEAHVARLLGDGALELFQVGLDGGVRVVRREGAVDALVEEHMAARQAGAQFLDHLARGAVAGVPGDAERTPFLETLESRRT